MAEKIANNFERTMKKGFVNIFVLLALHRKPTHGYQIKKLIEERTSGFWSPSDSTMYTILSKLREKGLIELSDAQDPEDTRKVYELTKKGEDTLELLVKREREMRKSMKSIILSTTDINDDFFEESLLDIIFQGPKADRSMDRSLPKKRFMGPFGMSSLFDLKGRPKEEQLKLFKTGKKFVERRIQYLTQILENIDKRISDIESE